MAQATCRVPDRLNDAIDRAAEESGLFRSEIIRRALIWYLKENPDNLGVLEAAPQAGRSEAGENEPSSRPYDPTRDV